MLHIFVSSLKRKKFSGDQINGKLKIIKVGVSFEYEKVREGKKTINEEVR